METELLGKRHVVTEQNLAIYGETPYGGLVYDTPDFVYSGASAGGASGSGAAAAGGYATGSADDTYDVGRSEDSPYDVAGHGVLGVYDTANSASPADRSAGGGGSGYDYARGNSLSGKLAHLQLDSVGSSYATIDGRGPHRDVSVDSAASREGVYSLARVSQARLGLGA